MAVVGDPIVGVGKGQRRKRGRDATGHVARLGIGTGGAAQVSGPKGAILTPAFRAE